MTKTRHATARRAGLSKLCLTVALCMCFSISAYAQRLSLSYNNVPIKTVLKAIEDQTDYSFVYSSSTVNVDKSVSIRTVDADMNTTLTALFKDQGIAFRITDNQVVLTSVAQQSAAIPAQPGISGTVKDPSGEPLIGAAVIIDDGARYAITNGLGEFAITGNTDAGSTISASYLGYKTSSMQVGSRTYFDITLQPDAMAIDNILVTGYQSLSRDRATGAFESVSSEILARPTTNVGTSLMGTVTGMQITSDAKGKLTMEVRGQTSLNANKNPLIVVDGFEIEGGLETLNPNNIENITILKDAASSAIWGARAANGVIVVTTLGGKFTRQAQPTKVEFSAFIKYSPKIDLDYLRPLASSAEFIEYEKLAGSKWDARLPGDGFGSYTYIRGPFTPTITAINEHRLGYLNDAQLDALLAEYAGYDNSDQIKKHLLNNPFTQQYNLNISGATERMSNNLSLLYEKSTYQKAGEDMWRAQASYRTNIALTKWLDFTFIGTYGYSKDTDNSIGSSYNRDSGDNASPYWNTKYDFEYSISELAPQQLLIDKDGKLTDVSPWYTPNLERHVSTGNFPYTFGDNNPISEISRRDLYNETNTARAQAALKFKIMQGLDLTLSGQYEYTNSLVRKYFSAESTTVRQRVNETSSYNRSTGAVISNLPKGGMLYHNRTQFDRWDLRAQLNFHRIFDGVHEISAIASAEARERIRQVSNNPIAFGYNPDTMTSSALPNGPGGSAAGKSITNWEGSTFTVPTAHTFKYNTDRYVSFLADATYTYDGKYTATASIRNDASNLITDDPSYRYSPFWSAGISWNMAHEGFMHSVTWINRLTPRLSYGFNGNVDSSTSFVPLLNMQPSANQWTNGMTATIGSYGNPSLRWERTGTWNFGVDYSMFDNKLFGKVNLYHKNTTDMIASISVPSFNGTTTQKLNNAAMTNRGFEIEIGTRQNIRGGDITWYGSVNVSYNKNKITDLMVSNYTAYGPVYSGGSSAWVEGYDAGALWVYKYNGLVNVGSESSPDWQPTIRGKYNEETGEYNYFTFGAWPSGDAFDISNYAGTRTAPWNVGLVNSFKIYDFDVSFIISGKFGHKFLRTGFNYPQAFNSNVYPNKYLSEVMNGDPNKIIPLPLNDGETRLYFWDRFHPYMDYLVADAGHIRLREISVTYNVPGNFLSKIGIDRLQVYALANNVWNIYFNKYNEDPEYSLGTVRPVAAFTLGIKATF